MIIITIIPFRETAQAGAEGSGWPEPEVLFQGGSICVGYRNITWLHRDEFLVRLEVIILRKHSRADKLLLKDRHEVKQILGMVVADIINFIRGYRESVLAVGAFGGMLHHAHHSLHNVVDIGKVPLAIAVVEDLYRFSFNQLVGESEIGHVGTSARAVYGEEAQSGGGYVVELGVGVGHQLVALLGGGVEAHGIIDFVVGAVRHFLVGAVYARATGIDQMVDGIVAACLEDVVESYEVALYVRVGIGDGISYPGLGREVDHNRGLIFREYLVNGGTVGDAVVNEDESVAESGEFIQPLMLKADVVIVGDGVDSDHADVRVIVEQTLGEVTADEACNAGHKHRATIEVYVGG